MKLFFVRHGESTWNVEGRYQGRQDPPLSPRGRAQANALASRVSGEGIAVLVASPLQRARETADICAQAVGLSVIVDEWLTEISHGEWEGKLRGEISLQWPDMMSAWQSTPHLVRFPAGESLSDVNQRLSSFLESLRNSSFPMLAVTHDVMVRLAILASLSRPLSAFNEVRVDNAALNEFALASGKLTAVRLNDTAHLGALRSDTLTQAL